MKRTILIGLALTMLSMGGHTQTFNEWFKQKKTQERYLAEQLVSLKVYADTAWKGYQLAKTGLRTIGQIRDGDFNLFEEFLAAMDGISPVVRDNHLTEKIIWLQGEIISEVSSGRRLLRSAMLGADKNAMLERHYRESIKRSLEVLAEMEMILKPFEMKMDDAERLKTLEQLYRRMSSILSGLRRMKAMLNNYSRQLKDAALSNLSFQNLFDDEN